MKAAGRILFWTLIAAGLAARILSLGFMGLFDMDVYYRWGQGVMDSGLAKAFEGIYFPFQYQVFQAGAWITSLTGAEFFVIFKGINLLFDCGSLYILYLILKRLKASEYYIFIYWLHPWFLNIFSLGYVDVQYTFFILCTLYFSIKGTSRSYLAAGIFLGFAFLMKPQVEIIFLAFFIYAVILYVRKKEISIINIFIFSAILFANYAVYFAVMGRHPMMLFEKYIRVANNMPCLNANALNIWFPVAYVLKPEGEPIYSVSDEVTFLGVSARLAATIAVLTIITLFIRKLDSRKITGENNTSLILIASFSALIVPFFMTAAHENHLFMASVLVIPVMAKFRNTIFKICFHVILLCHFINLYGYYGAGDVKRISLPHYGYGYNIALMLSVTAVISFLIMLYSFMSDKSKMFLHLSGNRTGEVQ